MRISDWSSDVCSSDLLGGEAVAAQQDALARRQGAADLLRRGSGAVRAAEHPGDDAALGVQARLFGIDHAGVEQFLDPRMVVRQPPQVFAPEVGARVAHPGDGVVASAELRGHHGRAHPRSEEHTSELQSLMRISYAVFCLKKTHETNKHRK